MGQGHKYIFSSSECLDFDTMQQYAKGTLPKAGQQLAEQHLVDCPMCSDALDGLSEMNFTSYEAHIDQLNAEIQKRATPKRGTLIKLKKLAYPMAAVIVLLACSATLIMIRNAYNKEQFIGEANLTAEDQVITNSIKETPIPDTSSPKKVSEEVTTDNKAIEIQVSQESQQNRNADQNSLKEDSYMANETNSGDLTHSTPSEMELIISEDEELEELEIMEVEDNEQDETLYELTAADERKGIASFPQEEEAYINPQAQTNAAKIKNVKAEKSNNRAEAGMTVMEKPLVFSAIDKMPQYPGGNDTLLKFIDDHLRLPKKAQKKGVNGTVILSFTVGNNGDISNIKILKSIGNGCDEEATKVVKKMPKWIPGEINNEPIAVSCQMNIHFYPDKETKSKMARQKSNSMDMQITKPAY